MKTLQKMDFVESFLRAAALLFLNLQETSLNFPVD